MSDWRRDGEWRYEHKPTGTKIERYDPPGNGHFSIWSVVGKQGCFFPTLREAKQYVERAARPHQEEQG